MFKHPILSSIIAILLLLGIFILTGSNVAAQEVVACIFKVLVGIVGIAILAYLFMDTLEWALVNYMLLLLCIIVALIYGIIANVFM